jgi:hypothetical protein
MVATAIGLRGQARPERHTAAKPLPLAALVGALILVSVAVNTLIVIADANLRPRSPITQITG